MAVGLWSELRWGWGSGALAVRDIEMKKSSSLGYAEIRPLFIQGNDPLTIYFTSQRQNLDVGNRSQAIARARELGL